MRCERFHFPGYNVPELAIFIMRTDTGTHTGIYHRNRGILFILEMRWHRSLRALQCNHAGACVIPNLVPEEINDVTAMCRLIHDRHNDPDPKRHYSIPY